MLAALISLLLTLRDGARPRALLHVELLAWHRQIHVLTRSRPLWPQLTRTDRLLWICFSRSGIDARRLVIVKPETVIAWHRRGFRVSLDVEAPSSSEAADRTGAQPRPALAKRACQSWNRLVPGPALRRRGARVQGSARSRPEFRICPRPVGVGVCQQGDAPDRAVAEVQTARASSTRPDVIALHGYILARARRRSEALTVPDDLRRLAGPRGPSPSLVAMVYTVLEDNNRAFDWLGRPLRGVPGRCRC
jgi:hypothetical protein